MNLVVVLPYAPTLLRPRSRQRLNGLIQAGHSVNVIYADESPQACCDVLESCHQLRKIKVSRWNRYGAVAQGFLKGMSISYRWYAGKDVQSQVAAFIECIDPDLVLVEHLRGMGMLPLPNTYPVIFDAVDALGPLFKLQAGLIKNPIKRGIFATEASRVHLEQKSLANSVLQCIAISEVEAGCISASTLVVPNGVDTDYFCPNANIVRRKNGICMMGRWDYLPNADGCVRFIRETLPHIMHHFPDITCEVIGPGTEKGSWIEKTVGQCGLEKTILLLGQVPDMRNAVRTATLTVCPVSVARGMQNKILESLAMGVPVVSTPDAIIGTLGGVYPGAVGCLPGIGMADAVCDWLRFPDKAHVAGASGRDLVSKKFGIVQVNATMERILHKFVL